MLILRSIQKKSGKLFSLPVLPLLLMAVLIFILPVTADSGMPEIMTGGNFLEYGDMVWFGNYDDSPVLWQVMGTGSTGSGNLLISKYILGNIKFNEEFSNVWQGSNAQAWCAAFYDEHFTSGEKAAVLKTTKTDPAYKGKYDFFGPSALEDEYVFFLSAEEGESYFPNNDDSRKAYFKDEQAASWWWLRSPYEPADYVSGRVDDAGWIYHKGVVSSIGARPAFNLDPGQILFASLTDEDPNIYKLTLLDETLSAAAGEITRNDAAVSIPYTVTDPAAAANRISLLVTDKEYRDSRV